MKLNDLRRSSLPSERHAPLAGPAASEAAPSSDVAVGAATERALPSMDAPGGALEPPAATRVSDSSTASVSSTDSEVRHPRISIQSEDISVDSPPSTSPAATPDGSPASTRRMLAPPRHQGQASGRFAPFLERAPAGSRTRSAAAAANPSAPTLERGRLPDRDLPVGLRRSGSAALLPLQPGAGGAMHASASFSGSLSTDSSPDRSASDGSSPSQSPARSKSPGPMRAAGLGHSVSSPNFAANDNLPAPMDAATSKAVAAFTRGGLVPPGVNSADLAFLARCEAFFAGGSDSPEALVARTRAFIPIAESYLHGPPSISPPPPALAQSLADAEASWNGISSITTRTDIYKGMLALRHHVAARVGEQLPTKSGLGARLHNAFRPQRAAPETKAAGPAAAEPMSSRSTRHGNLDAALADPAATAELVRFARQEQNTPNIEFLRTLASIKAARGSEGALASQPVVKEQLHALVAGLPALNFTGREKGPLQSAVDKYNAAVAAGLGPTKMETEIAALLDALEAVRPAVHRLVERDMFKRFNQLPYAPQS